METMWRCAYVSGSDSVRLRRLQAHTSLHPRTPTHSPSYKFQRQAKYTFAILFCNLETMQRSSKTSQTSKAKREPMIRSNK